MTALRPLVLGYLVLAVLVGGLGLWSVTATLSGAIVAHGLVEVEQNRQIVQHPDGGVVVLVAVRDSQMVQAGDLLLRLDGRAQQSELRITENRIAEAKALRARLEAERDGLAQPDFPADPALSVAIQGQTRLFLARRDSFLRQTEQLDKRGTQIAAQINGIDAQRSAVLMQLSLVRQELRQQIQLQDKGLTQSAKVRALQREEAQLIGDAAELAASRAQAQGRATEVALEKLRLAALRLEEANTQLRALEPTETELAEHRRSLVTALAALDIRAPVSGLILGLQVTTPQAVIRPAEPILYIIPQDRPLVIAAQIAPRHIDEISTGQPVRLVPSSGAGRDLPDLTGHVTHISADSLIDPQSHNRYFRAEIAVDRNAPDKMHLLAGMPVEAFIQTGSRTPLTYLLSPLTDYFRRALRES